MSETQNPSLYTFFLLLDEKGMILDYDHSADTHQKNESTMVGQHYSSIVPPEAKQPIEAALDKVRTGDSSVKFEYAISSSAQILWFTGTLTETVCGHYLCTVQDNTGQKDSEHLLCAMYDHAPIGIALLNSAGRVCRANKALTQMIGYTAAELEYMGFADFTHVEDIFNDRSLSEQLLKEKIPSYTIEKRLISKDGRIFQAQLDIALMENRSGDRAYVIAMVQDISERRQAYEDAGNFMDISLDALIVAGFDGYPQRISPAFTSMTGYAMEELLGTSFLTFVHPDDRENIIAEMERVGKGVPSINFENRVLHRDGHYIWLEWTVVPKHGKMYCIGRNITSRKKAEMALAATQNRLAELIDSASQVAIITTDIEGYITLFNIGAEQLLGYTADEVIGRYVPEIMHLPEEIMQRSKEIADKTGRTAKGFEVVADGTQQGLHETGEWIYHRKDGTDIYMQLSVTVIRSTDNSISGFLYVATDISELKKTQEALQASEERWHFALEGAGDGLWDWDARTNHVYFSHQWKKMLGYEDHEIGHVLEEWDKRVHPDDKEHCYAALQKHFRGETEMYSNEHRVLCKDGTYKWILDRGKVIEWDEQGQPLRVIGTHTDITIRKIQEMQLQGIAQNVPGMIYSYRIRPDGSSYFSYTSEGIRDIYGLSPDEVAEDGMITVEKIHPDDRERVTDSAMRSIQGLSHWFCEYRVLLSAERFIWVEGNFTPKKEEDGGTTCYGYIRDITDRKRVEEALIVSEKKYRTLFESMEDVLYQTDQAGMVTEISPSIENYSEYLREEIIGRPVHEFYYYVEDRARLIEALTQKGAVADFEVRLKSKSGRMMFASVNAHLLFDKNGALIGTEGIMRNISERKQAEETLRKSQERMEAFISQAPTAIAMMDREMKYLAVSQRWIEDYGIANREVIGISHYDLFPEITEEWKAIHQQCLNGYIDTCNEARFDRQDGTVQWLKWEVRPWYDLQGTIGGLLMFTEDISSRKMADDVLRQSKEYAEEANRAKTEFLANMSHEIRTPMNAILGFSEILLNTLQDATAKEYIRTIMSSGRTLLSLINDLLDLSKIESGKLELASEPLYLPRLLEDIKMMFAPQLTKKSLGFSLRIAQDFPASLMLDEIRLRQILVNLIGNAIKFTSEGVITLEVQVRNMNHAERLYDLAISVHDTGIGIAPEDMKVIFESFRQARGGISRNYGGTGLGLAITKRLVELMGGSISLQSQVGKGSVFTVILKDVFSPNVQAHQQADAFEWTSKTIRFQDSCILVADDIKANLQLVESYLAEYQIKILTTDNGMDAVTIASDAIPDLILMDIRMPQMDGREAARILKNTPKTAHIPIVAFTASVLASESEILSGMFDGMISKPVRKGELLKELMAFLPYETEESSDSTSEDNKSESSIDAIDSSEVQHHLSYLLEQYGERCRSLSEVIDLEEIEQCITEITGYLDEHKIDSLTDYMGQLSGACTRFDVQNIRTLLRKFSRHIQELLRRKPDHIDQK